MAGTSLARWFYSSGSYVKGESLIVIGEGLETLDCGSKNDNYEEQQNLSQLASSRRVCIMAAGRGCSGPCTAVSQPKCRLRLVEVWGHATRQWLTVIRGGAASMAMLYGGFELDKY